MFTASFFLVSVVVAQTIPVGMNGFDDQLRVLQLQGKLDIRHSLMARPFFSDGEINIGSILRRTDSTVSYEPRTLKTSKGKTYLELLPMQLYSKFNSDHPYSWNQPGFVQAKGLQAVASSGIYASAGWLSLQLKPELVYAANSSFPYNANYGAPTKQSYARILPGQSALRISKGGVSLGLSTENLYWGPGVNSALLMSSNAPGFAHLTFNSTKPLKTPIGNFEWQLIAGKLMEDTLLLLENKNLTTSYYNPGSYTGSGYSGPYDPRKNWRYINGITLSYNPKWIKGLFLSVNRVAYSYNFKIDSASGFSFFKKYFPVLFGVLRQSYPYGAPDAVSDIGYKQMASLAARFVFPNSNAEIYTEYGYGDNFKNLRDWNVDAPHSTAYLLGIRKLKKLNKGRWLDLGAEIIHMSEPVNYLLRSSGDWYIYQGGYTQQSRIIGAGVGKGNNAYTLKAKLLSGMSELGLVVQGVQHGPTQLVGGLPNLGIREIKWNDFAVGISGRKKFNKLILSAEMQAVSTKNYAWEKDRNRFNFYSFLAATYLW
jgi:hypothetical protein